MIDINGFYPFTVPVKCSSEVTIFKLSFCQHFELFLWYVIRQAFHISKIILLPTCKAKFRPYIFRELLGFHLTLRRKLIFKIICPPLLQNVEFNVPYTKNDSTTILYSFRTQIGNDTRIIRMCTQYINLIIEIDIIEPVPLISLVTNK